MTLNLSNILNNSPFADKIILIQEEPTAIGNNGIRNNVQANTVELIGSIQPINGQEAKLLPEGLQVDKTYKAYITNINNPSVGRKGSFLANRDKLLYQGRIYTVSQSKDWTIHGHTKLFVTLDDNQDGVPPINSGTNNPVQPITGQWGVLGREYNND